MVTINKPAVYAVIGDIRSTDGQHKYNGFLFRRVFEKGKPKLGDLVYDTFRWKTKAELKDHLKEYCADKGLEIIWKLR